MMPVWKWTEKFVDVRVCQVVANTEEEARAKRDKGNWADEVTVDFYSDELLEDISGPYDE